MRFAAPYPAVRVRAVEYGAAQAWTGAARVASLTRAPGNEYAGLRYRKAEYDEEGPERLQVFAGLHDVVF